MNIPAPVTTSKINWTQYVALVASAGVLFGVEMDPETQLAAVAGIQGVQSVATWVLRTFFNRPVRTM